MNTRDAPAEGPVAVGAASRQRRALQYDAVESRLFRVDGDRREEVALPPQLHRLVEHAAGRSRAAGGRPVLCTHDELIEVLWGAGNGTPQALAIVVHELRERIGPAHAGLVENVRGRGYRLVLRHDDPAQAVAVRGRLGGGLKVGRLTPLLLAVAALVVGLGLGLGWLEASSRVPPRSPILRLGTRGDGVLQLQRLLAEVGYDPGPADGQFGPATAGALREFQLDHGLVVDGEYGPNSRAALARDLTLRHAAPPILAGLALTAAAALTATVVPRRRVPGPRPSRRPK